MSSNTSVKETKDQSAAKLRRKPPEESFWKHYSPHHEFPLSLLSSAMLHAIGITFLLLVAFGIILAFKHNQSLPVEPVRLAGGGGGSPTGVEGGEGTGRTPQENITPGETNEKSNSPEDIKRPDLQPAQVADIKLEFNEDAVRVIEKSQAAKAIFSNLDKEVRNKLRDGLAPAKGKGGTGTGGGKDKGKGTGEGHGVGEGSRGTLSQRERRMLRWTMMFDTRSGADYLRQLESLGAILAIPKPENPRDYYIVRDLSKRPAELLNEDLSQIQRIYWIDDKPNSVQGVMQALGLQMHPNHFVAFMPQELEDRLAKMEQQYMGRKEENIDATWFKVVPKRAGGYDVVVNKQTAK